MRCLRKERERRFQHISEARVSLEELKAESESGRLSALAPTPVRRRSLAWPALAGAAVLGIAGWGYHVYSRQTAAPAEAKITR
jgi:ferric-dicitrate binding protein FerR (iron transport regulator)